MPSPWEVAYDFTHRWEKGIVTAEKAARIGDPGGVTRDGITQRTWERYGYAGSVLDLTDTEVEKFYHAHFWHDPRFHVVAEQHAALAVALFDFGVNSGQPRAVRFVQGLVGVTMDGDLGPVTLEAIGRAGSFRTAMQLVAKRRRFLIRWAAPDKRRRENLLEGLMNRVDALALQLLDTQTEVLGLASFEAPLRHAGSSPT